MPITERQRRICHQIVKEYIDRAKPVSSELLEEKCDFGISPAMIRIEMQKLADMGYICQPYTSAGRIPTNKGYRFYVDELLKSYGEDNSLPEEKLFDNLADMIVEKGDSFKIMESMTRELASLSSNLAISYLFDEDILWKDGWKEAFQNPEFKGSEFVESFLIALEHLEENLRSGNGDLQQFAELRVYVGNEKPLCLSPEVSLVISQTKFPENKEGVLAILGPKRMAYDKNIAVINSLVGLLTR